MAEMSAVRLLLSLLRQEGVEHVFGIPGGPIMPLYAALHELGGITPVLAKHEEGAAFMADGYARASGRFGVCCTTAGPGATNALTGIAVAHADHVPVLLLTAQTAARDVGRGAFQESSSERTDVVSLYKPVTKWSAMVHHPDRLADMARRAVRELLSGCPGPVHLSLPVDLISRPVPAEGALARRFSAPRQLDREAVKEAARLLLAARRPAILAGQGVNSSKAWHPLRSLAERLSAPVATTFKAKGALPEDHPLSLGVLGDGGSPAARAFVLDEADLVLVVGSSLGEASSCGWDPRLAQKTLVQVDVDPARLARSFPVACGVAGDAGTVLIELLYQVDRALERPLARSERPFQRLAPQEAPSVEPLADLGGGLRPQAALAELRAALPRDALVFCDNGTVRLWAGRHFPVYEEGTFFVNMGLASMGFAVAGSVGGALARPGRAVVALAGDAAFAMNGMEVHTAVEHGAPVVWVVFNNGGHGMIYHGARAQFGREFGATFREPIDVAAVARAMGARAYQVERPGELAHVARAALASGRPAVIDVATSLAEAPPMGARLAALSRAAAAAGG